MDLNLTKVTQYNRDVQKHYYAVDTISHYWLRSNQQQGTTTTTTTTTEVEIEVSKKKKKKKKMSLIDESSSKPVNEHVSAEIGGTSTTVSSGLSPFKLQPLSRNRPRKELKEKQVLINNNNNNNSNNNDLIITTKRRGEQRIPIEVIRFITLFLSSRSGICFSVGYNNYKSRLCLTSLQNRIIPSLQRITSSSSSLQHIESIANNSNKFTAILTKQGEVFYFKESHIKPIQIKGFNNNNNNNNNVRIIKLNSGNHYHHHLLLLDSIGCVYSIGSNEYGQRGLLTIEQWRLLFTSNLSSSDDHNEFDIESSLESMSKNLKIKNDQLLHPQLIPSLQHECIIDISCGLDFSMFLNRNGQVYTCGRNIYRQCGHSFQIPRVYVPLLVEYFSFENNNKNNNKNNNIKKKT